MSKAVVALVLFLATISRGSPQEVVPPPTSGVLPTSAVFVLGDSLSDVGNAAAVVDYVLARPFYPEFTFGLCNPVDVVFLDHSCEDIIYKKSRVSDGPVAVEVLAAGLGFPALLPSFHILPQRPVHGTDYAVAGATASGGGIDDLASQVDLLRLDQGFVLPADALYVVIIGGNDALDALSAAGQARTGLVPDDDSEGIITAAVAAIGDAVDTLSASGARRLIVANLPDLAVVPAVRAGAAALGLDETTTQTVAEEVTAAFNDALRVRLAEAQIAHPEADIQLFDLFSVVEQERLSAEAAGRNVTDACFDSRAYRSSLTADREFNAGCAPVGEEPPRFDEFFFWDALHPTGAVQAAVGNALLALYCGTCAATSPALN